MKTMTVKRAGILAAGLAALLCAPVAMAQSVSVESAVNSGSAVSLHLHPFLTTDELATLRLVATNEQALSLFVTSRAGHAAMALSPDEGFVRDGKPVPSAVALGDLPSPEAARTAALAACDKARKALAACVVVLEVAPPN
jgi:hypothetical protein